LDVFAPPSLLAIRFVGARCAAGNISYLEVIEKGRSGGKMGQKLVFAGGACVNLILALKSLRRLPQFVLSSQSNIKNIENKYVI
jgi:hypothetical protein